VETLGSESGSSFLANSQRLGMNVLREEGISSEVMPLITFYETKPNRSEIIPGNPGDIYVNSHGRRDAALSAAGGLEALPRYLRSWHGFTGGTGGRNNVCRPHTPGASSCCGALNVLLLIALVPLVPLLGEDGTRHEIDPGKRSRTVGGVRPKPPETLPQAGELLAVSLFVSYRLR
jgi:hypothetical protein